MKKLAGYRSSILRLLIFGAVFVTYLILQRHVIWLDEWRGFLGACYIWIGTILGISYWSGLFAYQRVHPEKRLLVVGQLALAVLLPLGVMLLLHYFKYVPLSRGIGGYLVGTLVLAPLALRFMWFWIDDRSHKAWGRTRRSPQ